MTKKIIEKLKEKLEKEKEEIEKYLKEFAKKGEIPEDWQTNFPHYDGESGSGALERAADEVEEYEKLISVEHGLETRLRDIKIALKKIERGNYGICEKCKKEIELERLKAVPEAKFCKKCKG
jgi:DnaK suppressor protein